MKKTPKKSVKVCEACGGENTKTHLVTYPIQMGEKQINVERVSVRKCEDCHVIQATKAGQEKIARCMMGMMTLMSL
ncbi:MAG: YgiT-type zinc finger protein [Bdellovibrionales bacterium]|jgi:YgiT-type zinc finger domain-containing protein